MNKIKLSICIPTFNRSHFLDETLKSIVIQEVFIDTSKVEVIISDNCSTDNTNEVVSKYVKEFPEKIFYYKNDINLKDLNYEKVLSLGRGDFLKLNNDTLTFLNGEIKNILNLIETNIIEKPIIFFSNGNLKKNRILYGEGLNFFISNVSFHSTWIGSFGMWKSEFEKITDFSSSSNLLLIQTDIIFKSVNSKKRVIIDDYKHFISKNPNKKGGYDLIEIFFDNYSFLLRRELTQNNISNLVYKKEMNNLLLTFFTFWISLIKNYPEKYQFEIKNYNKKFFSHYNIIIYILFLIKLNIIYFKIKLKKFYLKCQ